MKLIAYTDAGEFHATEFADGNWIMAPEELARFALDTPLPKELVVLGTLVVQPNLASADPQERFEAAYWYIDTYIRSLPLKHQDTDWDVYGYDAPVDDEALPADLVF